VEARWGSVKAGLDDGVVSRVQSAKRREENEIEFSRIVAFSDGVFAIAITLLVLQLGVPPHTSNANLGDALLDERQDIFAYALSFAVIGRFWFGHHRFFSDVTHFDGRLIVLNLFYLAWIVLMPFSSQILGDHGGAEPAVILYAVNMVGVLLSGSLLFFDARRAGLSRVTPEEARAGQRSLLAIAAVFLVSILVALVDPGLATYCWFGLFLVPIAGRVASRGSS
jgi:uncharacterized membrane protein